MDPVFAPSTSASARQWAAPAGSPRRTRAWAACSSTSARAGPPGSAPSASAARNASSALWLSPLPQAERTQCVEIVSARRRLPRQRALDDRLRLGPAHRILQERPREVVRRSGIVGDDRHRALVRLDRAAHVADRQASVPQIHQRAHPARPEADRALELAQRPARLVSLEVRHAEVVVLVRRQGVPRRPPRGAAHQDEAEGQRRDPGHVCRCVRDGRRRRSLSRTAHPASPNRSRSALTR